MNKRIHWAEVSALRRRRTAKMKSNTIILCTDVHYHKPLRGDIEQHSLHLTANRHLLSLADHHQHFQIWKDFKKEFWPTFFWTMIRIFEKIFWFINTFKSLLIESLINSKDHSLFSSSLLMLIELWLVQTFSSLPLEIECDFLAFLR